MSVVEKTIYHFDSKNHIAGNPEPKKTVMPKDAVEKKFSRVSRLRDMFQTGVIRPIEEIEDSIESVEPVNSKLCDKPEFTSTFPGSPPMSALRNHRAIAVKALAAKLNNGNHSATTTTTLSNGSTNPPSNSPISPCTTNDLNHNPTNHKSPPAFPPKPRHLSLSSNISPTKSTGVSPVRPSTASAQTGPTSTTTGDDQNASGDKSSTMSSPHTAPSSLDSSNLKSLAVNVKTNGSGAKLVTGDDGQNLMPSPISAGMSDEERSERNHVGNGERSERLARLSSWQCNTELDRVNVQPDSVSTEYQDFIVQSDAFHMSPRHKAPVEQANMSDQSIPALQHAEAIAVSTPDDEEEVVDFGQFPSPSEVLVVDDKNPPEPLLPIPSGLKLISAATYQSYSFGSTLDTVDTHGIHVLEDGNFLYSIPGIPNSSDTDSPVSGHPQFPLDFSCPADTTPLSSSPIHEGNGGGARGGAAAAAATVATSSPRTNHADLTLPDSTTDSLSKHVRFSHEPILVYSTHSTSEYNRRNEDIDPLAASAEYELEKHLEEMDLFTVDLEKNSLGMGISIFGLGVDSADGDQQLGIFLKSLTPGGAAEATGLIEPLDQIVEVDGVSLVGVSQQFAAKTLRSTRGTVRFLLARERDPANSRVAQLLNEQQEEEQVSNNDSLPKTQVEADSSLPQEYSLETLHKQLIAETSEQVHSRGSSDEDEIRFADAPENGILTNGVQGDYPASLAIYSTPTKLPPMATNGSFSPPSSSHTSFLSPISNTIGSPEHGPCSALKGTATAASTKRRQQAIRHVIQTAEAQVRAQLEREDAPPDPLLFTDQVTWHLANQLYDCHGFGTKLQTQVQSLEQRLTAQEAAADEAIERLCMQCRHVELELNASQDRLRQYTACQHSSRSESMATDDETAQGNVPSSSSFAADEREQTEISNSGDNCQSISETSPPILASSQLYTALTEVSLSSNDSITERGRLLERIRQEEGWIASQSRPSTAPSCLVNAKSRPANVVNLRNVGKEQRTMFHSASPAESKPAPIEPSGAFDFRHRRSLITSGGLSRRRLPSFIAASSPTSPTINAHTNLFSAGLDPSRTSNIHQSTLEDYPSPSAPRIPSCPNSSPILRSPVISRPPKPSRTALSSKVIPSLHDNEAKNVAAPPLHRVSPHRMFGVQLPGMGSMTDTSPVLLLRHRPRLSDESLAPPAMDPAASSQSRGRNRESDI